MIFLAIDTNTILRVIVKAMDVPVKIVLIVFVILTIVFVGSLIAEISQRMYINVKATRLLDALKKGDNSAEDIISKSMILNKHKKLLLELTKHKSLTNAMKENLAVSLLDNYNVEQDKVVKKTDLIVKLGPVFGLLGTLTPLGPGIIALSTGDTQTLSQSLLVAFDTTVVGLICAAVCTCISQIRKRWYAKDSIMLNLLMAAVVETECKSKKNTEKD